ncbi:hypothetical protein ACFXHA_40835 [Nocardia sp. NPDC059240]|uniref:hypothetical protein n=1 Tax=Nocardia sp. NPDC059240 TaxID=3346786 RepID=UPI0036CB6115
MHDTDMHDTDNSDEPEEILLEDTAPTTGELEDWWTTHTTPEPEDDLDGGEDDHHATDSAPRRRPSWRTIVGGIGVLGIGIAAVGASLGDGHRPVANSPTPPAAVASMHPSQPLVTGNSPGCAHDPGSGALAAVVTGQGPWRASDGAQAISVFEAAYYLARSGARARDVVAASAAIPDAETIQAGIDTVPLGTTYCARIMALTVGLYAVEVHETRPGEPESVWRQQISTSPPDAGALITAITHL